MTETQLNNNKYQFNNEIFTKKTNNVEIYYYNASISGGALSDSITTVSASSLTEIKEMDFRNATSITALNSNLLKNSTNLEKVYLPTNVTTISNNCFENCTSLTTIDLSQITQTIGNYAFQNCTSLTSTPDLSNVKDIGNSSFNNSGISGNIDLSSALRIRDYAFQNTSISGSITLSSSYNHSDIQQYSFAGTNISGIEIPNGPTRLKPSVFEGCSNLTKIIIPYSVTVVDAKVFKGCSSLSTIVINQNASLGGFDTTSCFYGVPSSSVIVAHNGNVYRRMASLNTNNNSATTISYYSNRFSKTNILNTHLTTTTETQLNNAGYKFNNEIKSRNSVNAYIYYYNISISSGGPTVAASVIAQTQLSNIKAMDFRNAKNITRFPNNFLKDATKLEGVYLPTSVTEILPGFCRDCTSLKTIDVSHITKIGERAFQGCTSLTSTPDLSNVTEIVKPIIHSGISGNVDLSNVQKVDNEFFEIHRSMEL